MLPGLDSALITHESAIDLMTKGLCAAISGGNDGSVGDKPL